MNPVAARLFQPVSTLLVGALLVLLVLALALAAPGWSGALTPTTALGDVSPFRWA